MKAGTMIGGLLAVGALLYASGANASEGQGQDQGRKDQGQDQGRKDQGQDQGRKDQGQDQGFDYKDPGDWMDLFSQAAGIGVQIAGAVQNGKG